MTIKHLMAATALTLTLGVAPALAQTADPAAPGSAPAESGASGSMDAAPSGGAGGGMGSTPPDSGSSASGSSTPPPDSGSATDTTTPPDSGTASDTTTPPDAGTASDTTTPPEGGTASGTTEPPAGETASDTPEPSTDTAAEAPAEGSGTIEFVEMQEDGQWLADDYIGTAVRNAADENLGNINDLLVNEDGSVEAAIVGVGGFLGIGEKDVAVNFDAITENVLEDGSIELSMEADREALENAPAFVTLEDQNDEATASSGAGGTTGSTPPAGGMGGGMSSPPPAAPAPQ